MAILTARAAADYSLIDAAEVRRALAVLCDPDGQVELRGLPRGLSYVYRGDNLDSLVEAAAVLSEGARGVYLTLNPLKGVETHRAARKADIARYRWLLVDVDTLRPKDHNATDQEKALALAVADQAGELLAGLGWPAPVTVDSGNGWHLLYRVDLPADGESQALLKGALYALAARCDTGAAAIDKSVHNHARVSKLPGTWARKGPHSPERPHRLATLVHVPGVLACVSPEQLRAIAAPAVCAGHQTNGRHSAAGGSAYGRAALEGELRSLAGTPEGDRNNQLNKSAFKLAGLVAGGELPAALVEAELTALARRIGLDAGEVVATFRSGFTAGGESPRAAPAKEERKATVGGKAGPPPVEPQGWVMEDLLTADLPPARWLIPGLLSEGLNVLVGKPKQGKSFLALNLALTVAAGGKALGDIKVQPAHVLYLSLEDKDRRIQYRARKVMGGLKVDLGRRLEVFTRWPRMGEGGLEHLERWAGKHGESAGLVVIDVLKKFKAPARGRGNAYDEDYEVLSPIKELADRLALNLLVIHHVKKAKADDWIDDVSGSAGVTGTADGVLLLARTRGEDEAVLKVDGRDVEQKEIAVAFDRDSCVWTSLGDAEAHTDSKLGLDIMTFLRKQPLGAMLYPRDIADQLKKDRNAVCSVLSRLAGKGLVYRKNHLYGHPPDSGEERAF